jgi:hypothetical protein
VRRLAPVVVLGLLVVACGSSSPRTAFAPQGPEGVVRVALTDLRWPLDPAHVAGRDELTVARAVFATPLRTDPATGDLRAGLCASWASADGNRTWRFRCAHAAEIARALDRMRGLPDAPAGWAFAPIAEVRTAGTTVTVRLRFPWADFPYVLTLAAAAPPGVPGPFRVVRRDRETLVVRRPGLRVVFRRLAATDAVRAFRRGRMDEAPVPLGDLQRLRLDRRLGSSVRVRPVLGVDAVTFQLRSGALAQLPHTRRVYLLTADRGDYAQLVPETPGAVAFSLAGPVRAPPTSAIRTARRDIANLPPVAVTIAAPADPELRDAAELLVAGWRELGLGPTLAARSPDARFERIVGAYPRDEAIAAAILLPRDARNPWLAAPSRARDLLLEVLARGGPTARVDAELRRAAAVVPVARVVSARLVSPRLRGWRQDALGLPDYSGVRSRAESRRP